MDLPVDMLWVSLADFGDDEGIAVFTGDEGVGFVVVNELLGFGIEIEGAPELCGGETDVAEP